jgi:uncharacterized protein (TIGR00369 family)
VPPPVGAPEQEFVDWANGLPMASELNIVCRSLSLAEAVFTVDKVPLAANPNGAVHGGIVSAMADQCLGAVSVANAPRDRMSVTASLHGQFHRPAIPAFEIRARLISAGRKLIFVECDVVDSRERRCATFQATMAVGGAERRLAS